GERRADRGARRIAKARERPRDRETFRNVLKADADRGCDPCCMIAPAEADPDSKAFGKIMERDRCNKEPDLSKAGVGDPFRPKAPGVMLRNESIDMGKTEPADEDRKNNHPRGHRPVCALCFRLLDAGYDQREERGGEHDAGGKA